MQETKSVLDDIETQKARKIYLKSFYPFYAANEVMDAAGDGTKREYLTGSVVVSSVLGLFSAGLFAWGRHRAKKSTLDDGGQLSMILKIAGVRLIGKAAWLLLKTLPNLRKAKSKEREVAKEIRQNLEFFKQDKDGNIVIFENEEQGTSLLLDKKDRFNFEGDIDDNKHEFPITLQQHLHFLYQKPSPDSFGGKFSHLNLIVDGSDDFRDNKAYIGGDVLFLKDCPTSYLNFRYKLMLNPHSIYLPYFKKLELIGDPEKDILQRKEYEVNIISCFNKYVAIDFDKKQNVENNVENKEKKENESNQDNKNNNEKTVKYDMLDMDAQAVLRKTGVCRHQATCLGFYLQRAKQDGYLTGTVRFESRRAIEPNGDGHAWLTYFVQGIPDPLVIDPVNKVFQFRSAITDYWKDFYDKWYNAVPCEKNYNTMRKVNLP